MDAEPTRTLVPQDIEHLRIVVYPAPILRETCAPVDAFGPEVQALADRMLALMKDHEGIGLAAPQVGVLLRMFVCNTTGEPEDDRIYENPRLGELTGAADAQEGCLSLPAVAVTMRRASEAVIEACDTAGEPFVDTGDGLLARVWQHENDHLDGRMIIDRMSTADEIANRRALKQLEADYQPVR